MDFWGKANKFAQKSMEYMEESAVKSQKGVETKIKETLRRKSDSEIRVMYNNRYNNEKWANNPNIIALIENEARRRGIY